MKLFRRTDSLNKQLIFITGAPRSGTSLVTKVIDAHPNVAVLMENMFCNRRRHWVRADFWNSLETLRKEISKIYARLEEPIVGNKVCTPEVWSADDINMFCNLFVDFKIVFVVRNPIQVALSRLRRENHEDEEIYNDDARRSMLLDFRSRFLTYTSSWRQSIETYWKFKDRHPGKVHLVYYEDFCHRFETEAEILCKFLGIPLSENILRWYEFPHHDANGRMKGELKYPDRPIFIRNSVRQEIPDALLEAISTIRWQFECWQKREL